MKQPRLAVPLTQLATLLLSALAAQQAAALNTYAGDPGQLGNPTSWRTAEFQRDWGLLSMGAEYAYAAGYSGAGIKVGVVDSGFFDLHPQFSSDRYHAVTVDGISGAYNPAYNDRHGTHVVGTIGASAMAASAAPAISTAWPSMPRSMSATPVVPTAPCSACPRPRRRPRRP